MGVVGRQAAIVVAVVVLAEDRRFQHAYPVRVAAGALAGFGSGLAAVQHARRRVVDDLVQVGVTPVIAGAAQVGDHGLQCVAAVFLHAPEAFLYRVALLGAEEYLAHARQQDQGDHHGYHQLDHAEAAALSQRV